MVLMDDVVIEINFSMFLAFVCVVLILLRVFGVF